MNPLWLSAGAKRKKEGKKSIVKGEYFKSYNVFVVDSIHVLSIKRRICAVLLQQTLNVNVKPIN